MRDALQRAADELFNHHHVETTPEEQRLSFLQCKHTLTPGEELELKMLLAMKYGKPPRRE
jgi:hypothetical protein